MNDLISRQAAIAYAISGRVRTLPTSEDGENWIRTEDVRQSLSTMPSAQPEHLTDDDFETIRIHLSAFKERLCNQRRWKEAEDYERLINRFISFASAQPEIKTDGDTISRQDAVALVNRAIRGTDNKEIQEYLFDGLRKDMWSLPSAEPKTEWIPCSERLPEENEVVLTQARFADDIKMAVSARIDYNYWTGWGTREVNVVAWMPLPKPWKGDK